MHFLLRLVQAIRALFGARLVLAVDMCALYRARLVAQSSDLATVDLQPDDGRLPGAPGVPLKLGIPGATMQVQQGAYLLLGWEGGDPSKPYAVPSWEPDAAVVKLVLKATTVYLGAESGADFVALAPATQTYLDELRSKFNAHTHAVAGGTASAPTALQQVYPTPASPPDVAADQVKAA